MNKIRFNGWHNTKHQMLAYLSFGAVLVGICYSLPDWIFFAEWTSMKSKYSQNLTVLALALGISWAGLLDLSFRRTPTLLPSFTGYLRIMIMLGIFLIAFPYTVLIGWLFLVIDLLSKLVFKKPLL